MTSQVTLLAVGDIVIDREKPETMFEHTAKVLRSGDITFAQLEQLCSDKGSPYPGQIPVYSNPRTVSVLLNAGFNVISVAGNHSLELGPEAFLDTMERLRAAGIQAVGGGKNVREARQPVILEKKGQRVGFLAYACTGPVEFEAGEEKAGHSPLRIWTIYKQSDYQPGTPPDIRTFAYKEDLAAMVKGIQELRAKADIVVVSLHWGLHFIPATIPEYGFEVGHAAIDAGADLILGHHPHILKGIEVYKGKVIFHSLGNFALEISKQQQARFGKGGKILEILRARYNFEPDPEYPTYPQHPEAKATFIAKAMIEKGKICQVSYLPCYINKATEPEILPRSDPRNEEVFRYVEKISRSQKLPVNFTREGDEIIISP